MLHFLVGQDVEALAIWSVFKLDIISSYAAMLVLIKPNLCRAHPVCKQVRDLPLWHDFRRFHFLIFLDIYSVPTVVLKPVLNARPRKTQFLSFMSLVL